tara:strand:- start:79 stop:429 length:351 start_codon:yes stop_codon:yes gene_type:complete
MKVRALALTFIKEASLPSIMKNIRLNTIFIILLAITLILFTINYIISPIGMEVNDYSGSTENTGSMQSFEVFHEFPEVYYPTKKNTKRYNDKLFGYLEHIQESRDKTFMKGKVFLK